MQRASMLVLALAAFALPATAFDLEKWADEQSRKFIEEGRREKAREAGHKDPKVRLKAVEFFSGNRDAASIELVTRALSDTDARVREAAASALWRIEKDAEPARAQLTAALEDTDPNVVARAAGALQSLGVKEADLVVPRRRVLEADNASVSARFLVARNLIGYEPPLKLLPPMLAYLEANSRGTPSRTNVELAQQVLERLVKRTNDRDLIPVLDANLRRAHEGQAIVAKTLGLYNPKPDGWTDTLVALLDSKQKGARSEALRQMRTLKQDKDVRAWAPRAAAMLSDPDSMVRVDALWALGAAGGLAASEVEKVVAALGDPSESVRENAARALGEMGDQTQAVTAAMKSRVATAARPALAKAMESDANKDVRAEAKRALAKIGEGGGAAVAAAAPSTPDYSGSKGSEAGGMAVLRARGVAFERDMFFKALGETDVEVVRAFLDAGMSAKEPFPNLGPPIRVMLFSGAACKPNERPTKAATRDLVKLLLERGADINAADANGNTALMEAASKGCDRETIRMMLKAGANMNATNQAKLTPFEMGLWMGHDGLDELIAVGYRLPKDKVKAYTDGYKDRPAALAMIKKATPK